MDRNDGIDGIDGTRGRGRIIGMVARARDGMGGRLRPGAASTWSACMDAWVGRATPGESWFRDRLAEAWRTPGSVEGSAAGGGVIPRPEGIDELTVLAPGTPSLVAAIATAKYDADGDPWRWLGARLGMELRATATWLERCDRDRGSPRPLVVPMPSPFLRRLHRGIDHTGLLAIEVAAVIRGRVRPWLSRRWGPLQMGAGRRERQQVAASLRRSARWNVDRLLARRRRLDPNRAIVVLDDVLTTGASLAAAARLLRGMGHRQVHAAILCSHPLDAVGVLDDPSTGRPPFDAAW